MPHPERGDQPDDDLVARVVDLLRAAATGAWSAGRWSVGSIGDGIDQAVGPLVARRVETAVAAVGVGPRAVDLERAMSDARSRPLPGRVANSAVPRIARRLAPMRAATRRSPVGIALWIGPGLVEAVTVGLHEIDAVAGHLASRARQAGLVPDVPAIHAAALSVLDGGPWTGRPDHRPMLRRWFRAAAGSIVPFGLTGRPQAVDEIARRADRLTDEVLGRRGIGPG